MPFCVYEDEVVEDDCPKLINNGGAPLIYWPWSNKIPISSNHYSFLCSRSIDINFVSISLFDRFRERSTAGGVEEEEDWHIYTIVESG